MRTIPFFRATTPLTTQERLAKRRLLFKDTLALSGIFAVTCVLAVLTWLLFGSYSQHQSDAAARWKRRGEIALRQGNAMAAVFDLRAALGYAPDDRGTEIELAGALAQAGRLQEATVYFNTLWEKEPGSGTINLQLARLAARQQQTPTALEHYHAAIYGTWEGDGTVRRRQVRLELVRYLIQQNHFTDARDELLIAAGNDTSTPALLEVAGLLEATHAPSDALHQYREVAARHPVNLAALEGAGQTAFLLGRYRTAKSYLERAVADKSTGHSLADKSLVEKNLQLASAVLATYPSQRLPEQERLSRVVHAHELARQRFKDCDDKAAAQPDPAPPADKDAMDALSARWQAARTHLTVADLAANQQLEQAATQLVYDTELVTNHVCGEPTGEDAILLRIATSPDSVDQ